MKRLLVLTLILVTISGARAKDGDAPERARTTAALEGARSSDPDAPDGVQASASPAPEDADPRGNPLWSLPLSALSATRNRPLFTATRRPPPPAVVAAPPPNASTPIEAKPTEPERPPFALVGTIVGSGAHIALLLNRSTNLVTRLREGETELGWRAQAIGPRSIVLQRGAESATLEFPKPSDPPKDMVAADANSPRNGLAR
jgi:general secretion pathway protein N